MFAQDNSGLIVAGIILEFYDEDSGGYDEFVDWYNDQAYDFALTEDSFDLIARRLDEGLIDGQEAREALAALKD